MKPTIFARLNSPISNLKISTIFLKKSMRYPSKDPLRAEIELWFKPSTCPSTGRTFPMRPRKSPPTESSAKSRAKIRYPTVDLFFSLGTS